MLHRILCCYICEFSLIFYLSVDLTCIIVLAFFAKLLAIEIQTWKIYMGGKGLFHFLRVMEKFQIFPGTWLRSGWIDNLFPYHLQFSELKSIQK